jgi:hypothetical protein
MCRRLAILFALTVADPFSAAHAETVRTRVAVEGDRIAAAKRYIAQHFDAFGVSSATLKLSSQTKLEEGGVVLRFEQLGGRLPVVSAGVSVVIVDGHIVVATGKLRTISKVTAGRPISLEHAKNTLLETRPDARVTAARLGLRDVKPVARPVWVLRATTLSPLDMVRVEIDGLDGKLLRGVSIKRHARFSVKGQAYMHNPTTGNVQEVTLQGIDNESLILKGEYADVSRCGANLRGNSLSCDRKAMLGEDRSYLHLAPEEPSVEDAFAEVHTYFHVDSFHRWLKSRFSFERQGRDQQIKVYVNYHYIDANGDLRGMSNAFFGDLDGDGKGDLVFGQANRDFAYDADVIYHEFTHSAVEETSGLRMDFDDLGLNIMPAALNEGFADLLSSVYIGDGAVGEYAGGSYGSMSIRDLSGKMRRCPEDLVGESHADGLIWGRLNWAIRESVGDKRLFDTVLYATMVGVQKTSSFSEAAAVLSGIANAKDGALGAIVDEEIKRFGLDSGCKRIVTLQEGTPRRIYLFQAFGDFTPAPLQYRIDVPQDATKMRIYFTTLTRRGQKAPKQVVGGFVRKGQPGQLCAARAQCETLPWAAKPVCSSLSRMPKTKTCSRQGRATTWSRSTSLRRSTRPSRSKWRSTAPRPHPCCPTSA